MMDRIEFPMWRGKTFVDLPDILPMITLHSRIWHVFFFDGMGVAPQGMSMQEFENLCRTTGYSMEWEELRRFAQSLKQTWNCWIVASSREDKRTRQEFLASDFAQTDLVIECFDSSTWTVRSKDEALLQRLLVKFEPAASPR
jgi:hypothetical protein